MRWWPVLLCCLVACSEPPDKPRAATRKERQQAAEVVMGKTPEPRTYRYAEGELRVIEVPSADRLGYVEHQRCYVWRDTELKTASLSCPAGEAGPALEQPSPRD